MEGRRCALHSVCRELALTRLGWDEGKTPSLTPVPTSSSTHWAGGEGGKGREAGGHATQPAAPPEGRTSPSSVEGHCRRVGGASRTPARVPQALLPPLQRLAARHPCTLPSLPGRPAARPHSPVPEPARPPSAASTGGRSTRSARSPMAGRGQGASGPESRSPEETAGGRSAGCARGGLSSARAAHWG